MGAGLAPPLEKLGEERRSPAGLPLPVALQRQSPARGLPEKPQPRRNPPRDVSPTAVHPLGAPSQVEAPGPTPACGGFSLWGPAPTPPHTATGTPPQPSHPRTWPPWAPCPGPQCSGVPRAVVWEVARAFPGPGTPGSGRGACLPASFLVHPWPAKAETGSVQEASEPCLAVPTVLLPSAPASPRSHADLCVHSPAPGSVTWP